MKITTHPCRCLQNQYKYIGGARWGGRNEHALGFARPCHVGGALQHSSANGWCKRRVPQLSVFSDAIHKTSGGALYYYN